MVFEALYEAAKENRLILVDGGMCRFHIRKDGQLTIYEIITTIKNAGIGRFILGQLKIFAALNNAKSIFAKCPVELNANKWYQANGFKWECVEVTKSGRELNHWRLYIAEEETKR
jgi:hypothetical protein